jgi:hypothetical protein
MSLFLNITGLYDDLLAYFDIESGNKPPYAWFVSQFIGSMSAYPNGITKAILLTEAEYAWKLSMKRGNSSNIIQKMRHNHAMVEYDSLVSGQIDRAIDQYR